MRFSFLCLFFLLFAAACEKESQVVKGNRVPAHEAISSLAIENFINKSYIDLLGRKPNKTKYDASYGALSNGSFSNASKESFMASLQSSQEYFHRLYELVKGKFINAESDQSR